MLDGLLVTGLKKIIFIAKDGSCYKHMQESMEAI
jgi:hypothetical protein